MWLCCFELRIINWVKIMQIAEKINIGNDNQGWLALPIKVFALVSTYTSLILRNNSVSTDVNLFHWGLDINNLYGKHLSRV